MRYFLMHKKIEVAMLTIDEINGVISSIDEMYNPEHFPLGVFTKENADRKELNDWWRGRSIPASRNGLQETLEKVGENDIMSLILKSCGLSLSDHYWLKPEKSDIKWEDINFFENDFSEDIGNILFGGEIPEKINFYSPDNTSDGWLKKRWKISNGDRVLIKGGSNPFQQEPFNEVIASRFMKRLGIKCVSYDIIWQDGYPYSICKDFVDNNTELIPAHRLMQMRKKLNHENTYQHFVSCCNEVGLDAIPFLDRMLAVDYIIANEDRHFNNFGLLRDSDTLKFIGFAPIYDNGTSLCFNRNERRFNFYESKPFNTDCNKQAKLITSLEWFDKDKAACILKDIEDILSESVENGFITNERVKQLKNFVEQKLEDLYEER
ncbi:MAG: HipA domain-containing protein [Lachnospiraceae bacterium]|nr:HipA domain-containing protein [Lachnospiraceae bacterium]